MCPPVLESMQLGTKVRLPIESACARVRLRPSVPSGSSVGPDGQRTRLLISLEARGCPSVVRDH